MDTDFRVAITNCLVTIPYDVGSTIATDRKEMADLGVAFTKHFWFYLFDLEMDLIRRWWGREFDARSFCWLILGEKTIMPFKMFLDRLGPKKV